MRTETTQITNIDWQKKCVCVLDAIVMVGFVQRNIRQPVQNAVGEILV